MAVLGLVSLLIPLLVLAGLVAGVVVLINKKKGSAQSGTEVARDVLVHLLATVTLYLTVVGVLLVIWSLAEVWFPQYPGAGGRALQGGPMRVGIAMAIVAFPVFIYLNSYTRRRESTGTPGLGAVFAYVNLFVVIVTALVDLMVVINAYLNGDLTPRFLVRAGAVLLMAALVYLYYRSRSAGEGGKSGWAARQPEPQT